MVARYVCMYKPTKNGPPKLILPKHAVNKSGNFNALLYNYCQSHPTIDLALVFHAEIGGLTRSERCFTSEESKSQRKAKGKDMTDLSKNYEINKSVSEEEAIQFLKPMKHNEYNAIDQLKKMPTKISLMSLILSAKLHQITLQKVLNKAYIPQDMTRDSMEHII